MEPVTIAIVLGVTWGVCMCTLYVCRYHEIQAPPSPVPQRAPIPSGGPDYGPFVVPVDPYQDCVTGY